MRVAIWRAAAVALMILLASVVGRADAEAWGQIRSSLFQTRKIVNDGRSVKIFAPKRAEDAAVVPITIYIAGDLVSSARQLTLIVDENPAPIAAVFRFGDLYRAGGNVGDRTIETRIRLDAMSAVRAVLETEDGTLYEGSQFVAGAGGCTSTSLKDVEQALAELGRTKLKVDTDSTRGPAWTELQIQIRHPNFSGMQIDTKTNTYTPAHFVERIDVDVGAEPLVNIESGIAISEDPNFRLSFARQRGDPVKLTARDTEGLVFQSQSE
jgi:sulfur-oxidizing protein SoxY